MTGGVGPHRGYLGVPAGSLTFSACGAARSPTSPGTGSARTPGTPRPRPSSEDPQDQLILKRSASRRVRQIAVPRIHPSLERVPGPRLQHPAVLTLLERFGSPARIRKAGRRRLVTMGRRGTAPGR